MYYIILNHQVVINKLSPIGIVSNDSTNLSSCQKNVLWLCPLEKGFNCHRIAQVKLAEGFPDDISVAFLLEVFNDGGTYETVVAGDVYSGVFFHGFM